jgi:ATP/maltotriose-dependent transcriptional regulator MalT
MMVGSSLALAAGGHIIKRPRLTHLLDTARARFILLIGPAGYGKTTLAREWVESRAHAWYRGGPASADVAALAVGLAEASLPVVQGAGTRMRARLKLTDAPDHDAALLAELLAEDLKNWPAGTWFVFDDYHFAMDSTAAEKFVEHLFEAVPIRLVIASRRRPSWATARRILYGEIFELGRDSLALDATETTLVLSKHRKTAIPGLQALAEGWPAVIGLAALMKGLEVPEVDVPSTLYEFFAQELFDELAPTIQWDLCQLAIAPSSDLDLARRLFGARATTVITEGRRVGFLTHLRGEIDFHPLLRDFLLSRLRHFPDSNVARAVRRIGHALIATRRWDDAFSIATQFADPAILLELVDAGASDLLARGRTPTLRRWLEVARAAFLASPGLDLADAEIHFRAGLYQQAERVALHGIDRWSSSAPQSSAMLRLAGESAYQMDLFAEALRHHEAAFDAAKRPDEKCRALWGQFVSAIQLERLDRARELLGALRALSDDTTDTIVQLATGDLLLASRTEGFSVRALNASRATFRLASQSRDPKIRGAFLHLFAHALVNAAYYTEALEVIEYAALDAERHRLSFAVPFTRLVMAAACVGLREFGRAERLIAEAEALSRERSDAYVSMSATALRARMLIALASPTEAVRLTGREWATAPSPSMYGEYLGSRAIALACAGDMSAALHDADRAERLTRGLDARAMADVARAVVRVRDPDRRTGLDPSEVYARISLDGCLDPFVIAYRGCPELLQAVTRDFRGGHDPQELLALARDIDLARALQLTLPSDRVPTTGLLSAREREVHELLARGLTNKQIAHILFISEPTVKVHVRRVLRKLGVGTRTQAALLYVRDASPLR